MLLKKDLLNNVDEKYIPMLKAVSIPDFTKCVAQFSGLHIKNVDDEVIKSYLLTWAKNKYRFFEMLGNNLYLDVKIKYTEQNNDVESSMRELMKDYPAYALWFNSFKHTEKNKIETRDIDWEIRDIITNLFPHYSLQGTTITHFFKNCLKAPDEIITKIGRIWENNEVEGTYTISIDPVDMMLASENPYNWQSCYRLAVDNDCSHADGCMAAVLDDSSLITYIWNKSGEFSLYGQYNFKNIRYKRMREWISISPKQDAIHFNAIYPGKRYPEDFEKCLREICENIVNKDAVWKKNDGWDTACNRAFCYGYGEFDSYKIYKIKDSEDEIWEVYNKQILCPCGCGHYLQGSDWDDDYEGYEYNGEGFIAENFYEKEDEYYCDYADDYVNCDHDCAECSYYNRSNAVCELDTTKSCENSVEAENNDNFDPYENNIVHCGSHCEGCPLYALHHSQEDPNAADKAHEEQILNTNIESWKIVNPGNNGTLSIAPTTVSYTINY